jgi:serine protease Do
MVLPVLLAVLALPATAAAEPSLESLFEKVSPAVVTIRTAVKKVQSGSEYVRMEAGINIGSGVVLHADCYVATAAHVVEEAVGINVVFKDGTQEAAEIVTLSRTEDLALLKVASLPKGLVLPPIGDSDQLRVGQPVFCIGAPLGLKHTLTAGVVSALRDDPRALVPRQIVQTDAALNSGNSGGALFNYKGEVVGIASYIATLSGGSMGLGFAVPSNVVRSRLFDHALPYLGTSLRYIPKKYSDVFNWPVDGLLVERVEEGSPAAEAGLRGGLVDAIVDDTPVRLGGDYILKVGELDSNKRAEVAAFLHALKEGDTIHYTVMREGRVGTVDVKVGKFPPLPPLPKVAKPPAPAAKR